MKFHIKFHIKFNRLASILTPMRGSLNTVRTAWNSMDFDTIEAQKNQLYHYVALRLLITQEQQEG